MSATPSSARVRTAPPARPAATRQKPPTDAIIDWLWKWFSSLKLARALILAIAGAALVGAIVMQAPPPALNDDQQFSLWVEQAREKYGIWTDVFQRLEFFNIFTALWFRVLVTLLAVNILVCTAHRTPRLLRAARRPAVVNMPDSLFAQAPLTHSATTSMSPAVAMETLAGSLKRSRFKTHSVQADGWSHIVAEKNRYTRLGTLLGHLGLITILLGAVWGGQSGWRESQFVIGEGGERAVGHDTDLSIRLESFVDEYYTGGGGIPKDYRSQLTVLKAGVPVASGTIRVNEPLTYDGVRIHQAFYGPAIAMQVRDANGQVLFDQAVSLIFQTADRPAGSFLLPAAGLEVFVIGPSSTFVDEVIPPGEVRLEVYETGGDQPLELKNISQGVPTDLAGLQFTFVRESRYTGLQVVKDPGAPLVWIGSAAFILGSLIVLYFPHRIFWMRARERNGKTELQMAAPRTRGMPFHFEFRRLAATVDRRLSNEPGRGQGN